MAQQPINTTNRRRAAWAALAILAWAGVLVMFPAFGATGLRLQNLSPLLASAGPWIAAGLASAAALVVYRVRRAHSLRGLGSLERLRGLSRRDFQAALAATFSQQGYVVENQAAAAGPVTLLLRKSDRRILVQCRHRTDAQAGAEAIERLHEAMTAEGASGGLIVTSTALSPGARALAADKPIGVIEGRAVLELLSRGRLPDLNSAAAMTRTEPQLGLVLADTPDCPLCRSPMLRTSVQSAAATQAAAWYCSQRDCGGALAD
jgi:hypothetical protein